ncbi:MAG: 2Fe-2S iron-sulfur cluster-binding protein [Sandaracinaceae bacterium]|nr:2Fe-2S iron-sulfur cluster-binding protein [Sandaracinaceae bacterium]
MPTFKIDGKEIPFHPGDTIIRAAWRQGIEIPHYCWHPGLSVAANCRMCLVEVRSQRPILLPVLVWDEKKKEYVEATKTKLQPACQVEVTEGMEVITQSPAVQQAQAAVQEFLLLNHPVDCPICDQAGECKLQDYWLLYQKRLKRKETEPVHKPKAVRFGPTIVYDAERCIMCTRCIRFCKEIVGDPVLDMRERGNKNEIVLAPGRELDHDYTLMTEHVCPVGALTSRDFRFKARVWFLRTVPGICAGCATGCNCWVDYDPRHQRVYRLRPRDNEEVNQYWMCDAGMLSYRSFHEGRILTGRLWDGGGYTEISRKEAVAHAVRLLESRKALALVLSAQASNEDNYAAWRLAQLLWQHKGATPQVYMAALGGWKGDRILRNPDNNPNRAGVMAIVGNQAQPKGLHELVRAIREGQADGVLSLGALTAESVEMLEVLRGKAHINLSSNIGPLPQSATVVVPIATFAETSGSFTNAKGMVQFFEQAIRPPVGIRSGWETILEIAKGMRLELPIRSLAELQRALMSHTTPTVSGTLRAPSS